VAYLGTLTDLKSMKVSKYIWPKDHNKYSPHQGAKEKAKRIAKIPGL